MEKLNLWLDIIGICFSLVLILCGDGDWGDYFFVVGWLILSTADLVLRWTKTRRGG